MLKRLCTIAVTTLALVATAPGIAGAAEPGPISNERLMALTVVAGDARAAAADDEDFAGAWIDSRGNIHISYRGTPRRAFSSSVNVATNARYTYQELIARRDKVSDHIAKLRRSGIHVVEWGPHEATNTLRLGVVNPSAQTVQALKDMFGADIEVESVPEPGPNDLFVTRWNDSSPWVTGGELNNGVRSCTSGPGILRNGGRYILTAAHCFAAGANVFNGSEFVGRNNWVDTRDRGTDTSIVTGTGIGLMFVSDNENDYVNMSTVPWTSTEGSGVCFNGAYSGRVCGGLVVIKTNYCTNVTGRLTCGTATAGRDGVSVAGHGDSGGPVHIVSPRWAYAGTIVGPASPEFVCARNNLGGMRTCSSWVRFQMIGPVLSHWGATLL